MITAKLICASKMETRDDGGRQAVVTFVPDQGRNSEWAVATTLSITVHGSVADRFQTGKSYTLQFVDD